jgi:hypothetical protein
LTDATPLLRLLGATLAVGVLPGTLVTLLWKPRPELTAMETIGFGGAVSFGLIQLMAILAIAAHLSPGIILSTLAAGCAAMAALVVRR